MFRRRPRFTFYIDVFGYCNLRCPSCPVGNWRGDPSVFHHGLMPKEFLERILDKAMAECTVTNVGLFNWTEPLLHPEIHDLVRAVRSRGIFCSISSNLNVLHAPDLLMAANPDWLRVSVSGFTQDIYVRSHAAGDIEKVKVNMRRLAEAKKAAGATTDFELYFHRYVDNAADEAPMKTYAESLGFRFVMDWALMMPLEKTLTVGGHPTEPLTEQDRGIIKRLACKPDQVLAVTSRRPSKSCTMRDNFIVLDVAGNAVLCCGCMASEANTIGNFLDLPVSEIQKRRNEHPLCKPCMSIGFPTLAAGAAAFHQMALRERELHQSAVLA